MSKHTDTPQQSNQNHTRTSASTLASYDRSMNVDIRDEVKQIKKFLGWYIADARRSHGLNREELAKLAGLTSKTIRKVEHGRGAMHFNIIARLSMILNAPLSKHLWEGE